MKWFPACLKINWDFENQNSTIKYDKKTEDFENILFQWRDCVTNYSDTLIGGNTSTICQACEKPYDELFEYYWAIYTDPEADFCVDVETTMNDTMHIWHNVWKCPDDTKNDRHKDVLMLTVSIGVFVVILALFYGGSYVQTERMEQNLIRCMFLR